MSPYLRVSIPPCLYSQDGKTALDFGQEGDDVKEALLSHRFAGEVGGYGLLYVTSLTHTDTHTYTQSQELEDEYLQDRLPPLVDRVTVRETDRL